MYCRVNNPLHLFFWSLCLALLPASDANAQFMLRGQVVDAATRDPLPFVNIVIKHNPFSGTTCDINGRFFLEATQPIDSITCSYVGYKSLTLAPGNPKEMMVVRLEEADIMLGEIVVRAGENPANRIIRNVIANKDINNPERIGSFRYISYNKVVYDFVYEDQPDVKARETLDGIFEGGHIFLMESVTERKFIRPDNSEENILGVKVSGFKEASFAPLATDLQPFSFYKDNIPILEVDYLNPISQGSLSKYEFHIRDTLFQGKDTVFVLSYAPLEGKNFEALTGLLYINTNHYAIQNVTAKPYSRGFIDVTIQQQYQWIDGRQWFPEQLKFELTLHQNASTTVGVKAGGISYIDSVQLDLPLRKKDFPMDAVTMDPSAHLRDTTYWSTYRPVELNSREVTTYSVLDSIGKKYGFDQKLKLLERFSQNRIPLGPVDFDISKFVLYNQFEGIRLGLGLYTNDKLIHNVSAGGYFGYGFHDHLWKYGGEVTWTLNKTHEFKCSLSYDNSVEEVGKSYLTFFRPRQFDFRAFLASEMDRIQQTRFSVSLRTLKYLKMHIALANTRRDPQYAYAFVAMPEAPLSQYTNTTLMMHFRYAFKEKLIWSMGQRISMGSRYPVLSGSYTHGFNGWMNGDLSYNRFEARVEHSVYFRNLGESRLEVSAGYIDQPVPYSLLFTGEGSYVRNWSVLIRNSFQTVKPYTFLSDRYVDVHYSHNFGSLLLHADHWKPSVTLHQNIGWGRLSHPEYHQGVAFFTKEKGLYETGLTLDNLVKMKYLNVSYMGFGAGVFYRYGPYHSGHYGGSVAFTLSVTFTTK